MLKANNTPLEASNIANYGSQMHEDQKQAKANAEAEWQGCGQQVGVEVWRIENFGVKKQSSSSNGQFYSDDSYIILNTYKKNQNSESLSYDLFYWIGSTSSQDEYATAAYKVVELDDYLNGLPVQYREVQDNESQRFLSVFNNQITIMNGGIQSAFNQVKPEEYQPRLLHLKGKRHVKVVQVALSINSLNHGDVFIVDNGLTIYVWEGKEAGIFEKRKSVDVVEEIKQQRNGRPKSITVVADEDNDEFWKLFDGDRSTIADAIPDNDNNEIKEYSKVLLKVSDNDGQLRCQELQSVASNQKLNRLLLDSDDVFIVDLSLQLFVWIGKAASNDEKKNAFKFATSYLQQHSRSLSIPIVRLVEGGEVDSFNMAFE